MMEYREYTAGSPPWTNSRISSTARFPGIHDVVTFQGKTLEEIVQAFHDSVDDYLAFCAEPLRVAAEALVGKFLGWNSPVGGK